ncbi:hypothetical protein, conserved [Plasmodium gonderi]|uniref:ubiquitinyl hydrolase 1 n=1 Tax=Plasmodium gonderi TaxID=77519 RepID=A0A1Y1JF60_PLAGO|nr:hypothetical protein, conserved [Plasmodium gonderi]GAW80890.1 hypothetical protein, conserved [Plasmodium gonderi]
MCNYEIYAIETERGSINVYFEKQSKFYCLVHTANNILQAHVYSPDDFKDAESTFDSDPIGVGVLNDQGDDTNNDKNEKNCNKKNYDYNNDIKQSVDLNTKEILSYNSIRTYIKRGVHYFGNFNVNILYFFMNKHNIELTWVDNKEISQKINKNKSSRCNTIFDDNHLNDKKLIAFVINVVRMNIFHLYHHRHFYTIRKISGMWFQLDSSLSKPILFPTNEEINKHLINIIKDNKFDKSDNYIIQVFKKG